MRQAAGGCHTGGTFSGKGGGGVGYIPSICAVRFGMRLHGEICSDECESYRVWIDKARARCGDCG